MQGILGFHDLLVACQIGATVEEREKQQFLSLDLKVLVDLSPNIENDQLQEGLDYSKIADLCREMAVSKSYALIETLAFDIVKSVQQMTNATYIWVRVKKAAPLPHVKFCFCELEAGER